MTGNKSKRPLYNIPAGTRGMTLVEVMVAFFMLVAGIGSLMTVVYRVSTAREETFVRLTAMSEVERAAAAVMMYAGCAIELYSLYNDPPRVVITDKYSMDPPDENTTLARITITETFEPVGASGPPLKVELTFLRHFPGEW